MKARLLLVVALLGALVVPPSASGAPSKVRYLETPTHGFVVLRSAASGDIVAHGEFVQRAVKKRMESVLTFHFLDGSSWEETVVFSQQKVFRLISYRLVQRGPSFPEASDVSFDRDRGRYRAKVGDADPEEGTVELPEDLHNGMTGTVLRNLPAGASGAGHILALTPQPRLLDTELRREGEDTYFVGSTARKAARYLMKAELRGVVGAVAALLGKQPPEARFWLTTGAAPTIVKVEAAMFLDGPVWRIEPTAPRWTAR